MSRLLRPYRCPEPGSRRRFGEWYDGCPGRALLQAERAELEHILPGLFGFYLLQVGRLAQGDLLKASRVSHRIVLEQTAEYAGDGETARLTGEAAALPFTSGSLDVVLLHHTLEFEVRPHQVLREVERVLIPEGHVVIMGFNPWSLWGLWRLLAGWRGRPPWCIGFLAPNRVRDWLALLGFDTVLARGYFFRPPVRHPGLLRRLGLLERAGARWWSFLGGGYVLVARKRVSTVTPIRPRWRARRRWVPEGAAPTMRREQDKH